jgi:hypothetical protein
MSNGAGTIELTEDLKRAWRDGVEMAPGTFMTMTQDEARAAGFDAELLKAPTPTAIMFVATGGYAFLERIKDVLSPPPK